MSTFKPYTISIQDSQIADLKQRLSLAKFPDELDGAGWDLGSPLSDVKRLTQYWLDDFDWRKAEQQLNKLPHYSTKIQCKGFENLNIHFLYKKSNVKGAVPLLFCHGWPGSFIEVTKILDSLVNPPPGQIAFDVVAPSLPNYGFSEGTKKRGFAIEQYAETLHKLMTEKLGYDQYVTQGGDWGYAITRGISYLYPQHCKANHLNTDIAYPPRLLSNPILFLQSKMVPFSPRERIGEQRSRWFEEEGYGYNLEHSTKPQTIGYGLTDSPVALLSWIYEKLHDWTDGYPWTDDEILTWISIYWFSTAGPAAACRIYYEIEHDGPPDHAERTGRSEKLTKHKLRSHIPIKTGISHFPRDIHVTAKATSATMGDVVFQREYDQGGHFAAWEMPETIIKDVREMFGKGGGAYGVVSNRAGY